MTNLTKWPFSRPVQRITPDPDCFSCHGLGETPNVVPYGNAWVTEWLFCDCVLEQAESNDVIIELERER